jgi:hypothetical protein
MLPSEQEHPKVKAAESGEGNIREDSKDRFKGLVFEMDQTRGGMPAAFPGPGGPLSPMPQGSKPKVLLGIGHDLAIARMVGSFDRNDTFADFWVLVAEIFGKFRLRVGGANNQDFAGIGDDVHHLRKKLLVQAGMTAADRIGLMVDVPRREVRMQGNLVFARQADVKNLSLRMVDPNDGVEVSGHGSTLSGPRSATPGSSLICIC